MELGDDHVGGRLADGVDGPRLDLVLVRELDVAEAGRDEDRLLGLAPEEERDEEVEEVDLAQDVDLEELARLAA